jgi:hypothetical protein
MKHILLFSVFALGVFGSISDGWATEAKQRKISANDEIVFLDGTKLDGRILAQDATEVIFLVDDRHLRVPKSEILRIYDRPDGEIAFPKLLTKPGHFPPWWVPAYDLFFSDWVKDFKQIPAVLLTEGDLANVPYLSFLANQRVELNIYGDPHDPAGVEIGLYGRLRSSHRFQEKARLFMASYLDSLKKIRALNALPNEGGRTEFEHLVIEVTTPRDPNSFGGWWLSMWNPEKLEAARVSAAELEEATTNLSELVEDSMGVTSWNKRQLAKASRKISADAEPLVFD